MAQVRVQIIIITYILIKLRQFNSRNVLSYEELVNRIKNGELADALIEIDMKFQNEDINLIDEQIISLKFNTMIKLGDF